jgi:hypothetical protein
MKQPRFNKVDGVEGKPPHFGVLSLGRKDDRGIPIETRQFHIVNVKETGGKRLHHQDFMAFNTAPREERMTVRGNIMYAHREQCFRSQLFNYTNKNLKTHPFKRPFCEGDGITATRWMGDRPDNFTDIECPNRKCEFQLSGECKSLIRFSFMIRWTSIDSQQTVNPRFKTLPSVSLKYVSRGWNMIDNFYGFFEDIDTMAKSIGYENYSLAGLPIVITVSEQTRKPIGKDAKPKNYPVVRIAYEDNLYSFFVKQRQLSKYLASGMVESIGLLSPFEQSREEVAVDYRSVAVNVPEAYQEPEEKQTPVQIILPEKREGKAKAESKKHIPMSLAELKQLAAMEQIPDDKLAAFVFDICDVYSKSAEITTTKAYELLFTKEDAGKVMPPLPWQEAKSNIELLRKYAAKAAKIVGKMK